MDDHQQLLTFDNAKTIKGEELGWRTAILYMLPSNSSGTNVCQHATKDCIELCLNVSGFAMIYPRQIMAARKRRTLLYVEQRDRFYAQLHDEINQHLLSCRKLGKKPCVRLNGTSDLLHTETIKSFPLVQFYDYTKDYQRMMSFLRGELPKNYHLTYSHGNELRLPKTLEVLNNGGNVAVVFARMGVGILPSLWNGYKVFDGDEHDLRFLNKQNTPQGIVLGLVAKGRARSTMPTKNGFINPPHDTYRPKLAASSS